MDASYVVFFKGFSPSREIQYQLQDTNLKTKSDGIQGTHHQFVQIRRPITLKLIRIFPT